MAIVGTKNKRGTNYEEQESKRIKKKAKYRSVDEGQESNEPVCSSCHQEGHKSSRSKACPNHKLTKTEEIQGFLGNHTTSVTRKINLDTILRPEYKTVILNKVQTVSEHVRNVMIRAQLFVNYYIITHSNQTVDKKLFTQNFWYAIYAVSFESMAQPKTSSK
jgi:hypothetical protein